MSFAGKLSPTGLWRVCPSLGRHLSGYPIGPEASTQLRADVAIPANTARAKHRRGKDAHQVDDFASNRFRAEDESNCNKDGG
jgi:hypothetical protein